MPGVQDFFHQQLGRTKKGIGRRPCRFLFRPGATFGTVVLVSWSEKKGWKLWTNDLGSFYVFFFLNMMNFKPQNVKFFFWSTFHFILNLSWFVKWIFLLGEFQEFEELLFSKDLPILLSFFLELPNLFGEWFFSSGGNKRSRWPWASWVRPVLPLRTPRMGDESREIWAC